jgi:striatin 1/3/4
VSAGDDATVKFWRVGRGGVVSPGKKKGNFDVLPQLTYRGHSGMVTSLAESAGSIWSGGSDGGIRGWKVPSATRDAYGSSGKSLLPLCPPGLTFW